MSLLKIAAVQFDIAWKDVGANISRIEALLDDKSDMDLIVLPEMFATGFIMDPNHTELQQERALEFMRSLAASKKAVVCGSLAAEDSGEYFNRFYAVDHSGVMMHYDKRHLFKLAGEHKVYSSGVCYETFEVNGFKIRPIICYDLRFPLWMRQALPYDLLLCVANWPAPRINAWDTLLAARAIENQCFAFGVNRVGDDPNQNRYLGHSALYDPLGNRLAYSTEEEVLLGSADHLKINEIRSVLPYLEDRDFFEIK